MKRDKDAELKDCVKTDKFSIAYSETASVKSGGWLGRCSLVRKEVDVAAGGNPHWNEYSDIALNTKICTSGKYSLMRIRKLLPNRY